MQTVNVPLDGNSAAGLFSEVFAVDMTSAQATCAGCDAVGEVGTLRMWAVEMGAVLRCPSCGSVVLRLTSTPSSVWIDASGARSIAIQKKS
jgi:predicted oxidoreductase